MSFLRILLPAGLPRLPCFKEPPLPQPGLPAVTRASLSVTSDNVRVSGAACVQQVSPWYRVQQGVGTAGCTRGGVVGCTLGRVLHPGTPPCPVYSSCSWKPGPPCPEYSLLLEAWSTLPRVLLPTPDCYPAQSTSSETPVSLLVLPVKDTGGERAEGQEAQNGDKRWSRSGSLIPSESDEKRQSGRIVTFAGFATPVQTH